MSTSTKINLSEILEEMFMVLNNKEKDVIVKRFSLDNKPRRTLESIGQQFSVTRERIRQIEKIALGKLRRTVTATRLNIVNEIADRVIKEHGGLLIETKLISSILNEIASSEDVDAHIIRLALSINQNLRLNDKTNQTDPFWSLKDFDLSLVNSIVSNAIKVLKKKGDVLSVSKIVTQLRQQINEKLQPYPDATVISSLEIDKRLKEVDNGFGLITWRHINPRSIRDKAYIVLKKKKEPLHFIEIANQISASGFDRKVVTTQAVHNELIRYDQFVLVGRGLYALKEWGYKKGTVADVIEGLLEKKSPLSKQDIIKGVLKQRQVKKGTISLNLQKNAYFVRVGRAMYALDKKKK